MSFKAFFSSKLNIALRALELLAHMHCFLIIPRVTLSSCLIIKLGTLKLLPKMYRSMMSKNVTFMSSLMITLWTFEPLAHMYRTLRCLIFALMTIDIETFSLRELLADKDKASFPTVLISTHLTEILHY